MNEQWRLRHHDDDVILTSAGAAAPPNAKLMSPELAAWRAGEWFGTNCVSAKHAYGLLAEICSSVAGGVFFERAGRAWMTLRVQEALRDRRLLAFRAIPPSIGSADFVEPEEQPAPAAKKDHFLEVELTYPDGEPVADLPYEMTRPGGAASEAKTGGDGMIKEDGCEPGVYLISIKEVEHAGFAQRQVRHDEEVHLIGRTSGYPVGTPAEFRIYREYRETAADVIDTVSARVEDDTVSATWTYDHSATDERKEEQGYASFIAELVVDGEKWAKSDTPLVVELKTIVEAKWSCVSQPMSKPAMIDIETLGFADAAASVTVFEVGIDGQDKKLATLDLQVEKGRVCAEWLYEPAGEPDDVFSPECFFEVTIDDRTAVSDAVWLYPEEGQR